MRNLLLCRVGLPVSSLLQNCNFNADDRSQVLVSTECDPVEPGSPRDFHVLLRVVEATECQTRMLGSEFSPLLHDGQHLIGRCGVRHAFLRLREHSLDNQLLVEK